MATLSVQALLVITMILFFPFRIHQSVATVTMGDDNYTNSTEKSIHLICIPSLCFWKKVTCWCCENIFIYCYRTRSECERKC
ncbi:hypothetical protein DCAR_0103171 [Daucus carota subsp. sativus]|uniref:Uncharacterized protein n=1 Tax=Daucus carota subsp. sativus TaxID=79200 RepID=A0AAF0W6A4_DAUCS|nr:hypothetical protein DCAR_0103171 [Daucus carota subsp. sativus]